MVAQPLREFLQVLRTGKSPIAMLLDGVLADPASLRDHPHYAEFQKTGHADVVDDGCREWLGLSETQVAHINAWPARNKEHVRQLICYCIKTGTLMDFRWRLTSAPVEEVRVEQSADRTVVVHLETPTVCVRREMRDGEEVVEVGESSLLAREDEAL